MDLVSIDRPLNAVSHVDPKLVGKKGDDLAALVLALCANGGIPLGAECRDESKHCEN